MEYSRNARSVHAIFSAWSERRGSALDSLSDVESRGEFQVRDQQRHVRFNTEALVARAEPTRRE
jgi:hypothetical protein